MSFSLIRSLLCNFCIVKFFASAIFLVEIGFLLADVTFSFDSYHF